MSRRQKGSISINHGSSWLLRWRENGRAKCKTLGEVTAEHRRNRDKKTRKLRVPDDIQAEADKVMNLVNAGAGHLVMLTIEELVGDYLKDVEKHLKPSTMKGYRQVWNAYLKERIGARLLRDFTRADCFRLWEKIQQTHQKLSSGKREKVTLSKREPTPTKHEENSDTASGLSKRTFAHIRFFLSGVFEWAKNRGMFEGENPATADLPAGLPKGRETEAYSVQEVAQMLSVLLSPLTKAVIAVAFGSGLRKGEIAGLDWRDYRTTDNGASITVRQSCWNGKLSTPKTEASADTVHLAAEFCAYVEAWWKECGEVSEGLMFGQSATEPINLDALSRWQIQPVLERCATCSKQRTAHKASTDHNYQRNQSVPRWKGWHAFRRGSATYLASRSTKAGIEAASLVLRHADTSVTEAHYNLNPTRKQDRRIAAAAKANRIEEQKQDAARALGQGLKGVVN